MGVYKASLPRLRAQRPPPSSHNDSRRLTYDLPPETPGRAITAKLRRRAGPLGFVRVALCWVCHQSPGFPPRRAAWIIRDPAREDPVGGTVHLPGLRRESVRRGPTVERLGGACLVRCWEAFEGSLGSSVTEARQHHSELRRTAPPAADSRNSVRCEGGDPAGCCCSQLHISAGPN